MSEYLTVSQTPQIHTHTNTHIWTVSQGTGAVSISQGINMIKPLMLDYQKPCQKLIKFILVAPPPPQINVLTHLTSASKGTQYKL